MRIGFDAKRAFTNTSGLGNYSRNTLNALQKYHSNHSCILYTPEVKFGMLENQDALEIIAPPRSDSNFKKSLWRTFQLGKEVQKQNIDLFHGLSSELPKGIHKTNIPSLVTIHDLIFVRYPEFYKAFDRSIYFKKAKYACCAATKILAISEQTKTDIVDFIGVTPDKIDVLHQCISPVFFKPAETEKIKAKYHLPDVFILAVGSIVERKNQLSIIKALVEQKLSIPLVLVGNPSSYCNEIHKYLAKNGIKEQVIFLKNIPEDDLAGIYQIAKLSIYISVFEGFGLPVIEAMASACPVITSTVSCLPETAGDAALFCSPDDIDKLGQSINDIINNEELRKTIIEKGKKRAEEFCPEKYVQKLVSLYEEIS